MPGTVTDPRFIAKTAVGLDWQATEGEAVPGTPFTPKQFIVVMDLSRDPDPTYIEPGGTHGSIHRRFNGDRIVSQAFKKELKCWGGRIQVLPFLESFMSGRPTVPFVDMTLGGVGAVDITALSFTGLRPHHNTTPLVSTPASVPLVVVQMVEDPGFPVVCTFYADLAKTVVVATATVAAAATPTALVPAAGALGLSGSITLATAATADATATIDKVTMAFENQFTRYFRLYYSDGDETVVLSDCVVQALSFSSSESGELAFTVSVMARRRTPTAAQVLTVLETELDLVPYSHSELTLTVDPSGSPATPVVDEFAMEFENNVLQYIGNSTIPQKLIKRGFVQIKGSLSGESADETMALVVQARSNTAEGAGFKDMRADYLLSGRTMRMDFKRWRPTLSEPGIDGDLVGKVDVEWMAFDDGVDAPVAVTVDL